MSGPTLSMQAVATRLGLHYDTFRKGWRGLYHDAGFPAPLVGKRWDAAAVEAWIARRSQGRVETPPRLTANTNHTLRASPEARTALQQLRSA